MLKPLRVRELPAPALGDAELRRYNRRDKRQQSKRERRQWREELRSSDPE